MYHCFVFSAMIWSLLKRIECVNHTRCETSPKSKSVISVAYPVNQAIGGGPNGGKLLKLLGRVSFQHIRDLQKAMQIQMSHVFSA